MNGGTMIDVLSNTDFGNFVATGLCMAVMVCAVIWMNKRGLKRGSTAEGDVMFYPLPAVGRRFADNFGATLQHLGVMAIVPEYTSTRFGEPILRRYRAELVSMTGEVSFFDLTAREIMDSPVTLRLESVSGEWFSSTAEPPPRGRDTADVAYALYLDQHYDFARVLIRSLEDTVESGREVQRAWKTYIDDGEPMKVQ
jgi:hypothetical protein